ncbi:MAG: outer rane efflux protein [Verrucomicrobiaceae bacterium]|nr:outer rane efflux protein [Verrucomicrobiaceae bacterium]
MVAGALLMLLLSGCAGLNRDAGWNETRALVHARTGADLALPHTPLEQRDVDTRVAALLRKPLNASTAAQAGLLNNKRLRATLEELNLSQARLLEAGLLKNPSLATSLRFPGGGGGSNSEFGLTGEVLNWLLTPLRHKMALREYEAAKRRVSHEALDLAAEVKTAMYEVQARQEFVAKLETASEVNGLSSDIAERLHKAGDMNSLELLQEQTSAQQTSLDVQRGKADLQSAREKVSRLLGLSSTEASRWTSAAGLPPLPASDPAPAKAEALALAQRQDLAAQRETVATFEHALVLQKKTRLIPGLTLGVDTEREVDGSRVTGPTLDLELPLFNWGGAKMQKAEAETAQARSTLEALQSEVASDVRMALADLRAAREMHRRLTSTLLPQRQKILAETLLHYNAMQVSTFVLLRAKEDVVKAEHEAVEARRAYWTAWAQLEKAMGGSLKW